jgi:hypothetical protein
MISRRSLLGFGLAAAALICAGCGSRSNAPNALARLATASGARVPLQLRPINITGSGFNSLSSFGSDVTGLMAPAPTQQAAGVDEVARLLTPNLLLPELGPTASAGLRGVNAERSTSPSGKGQRKDDVIDSLLGIANTVATPERTASDHQDGAVQSPDNGEPGPVTKHEQDSNPGFGDSSFSYLNPPK